MKREKKIKKTTFARILNLPFLYCIFGIIAIGNIILWLIKKMSAGVVIFFRFLFIFVRLGKLLWSAPGRSIRRASLIIPRRFQKFLRTIRLFAKKLLKALIKRLKRLFLFIFFLVPRRWRYFLGGIITTLLFFFLPYQTYAFLRSLPNPTLLITRAVPVTTKIFDRHGQLLYEMYVDQNRTPIRLSEIPPLIKQATIAIEDQNFYNHIGVSFRGIIRAAYETLVRNNLQGGSTITQQLIKSALLSPETTFERKVKEIILAFWAERLYSKDQILEMYLNQVPYGGTAWGIEAAAQTYFNKPAKDLNLAEITILAGLPAAPTIYSPFGQYPQLTKIRQAEVLRKMVEAGFISAEQEEQAKNEPLVFAKPNIPLKAPHFVMYVRDLLAKRYGLRMVEQGGLRVITTLDLSIQNMTQEIVATEVDKLTPLLVSNGAAMVVDAKKGEILSMVGGKNYFDTTTSGNVNVAVALRQPGSAIKVVTYAAALDDGFTAGSILDDSPVTYVSAGSRAYRPVNYDERYHGLVPLRYALGNSYNIPAVKVLARLGVPTMVEKGRKMGIRSWSDPSRFGLSLTLGSGEVTMLDMMSVYTTLANEGRFRELTPIFKITNYRGEELESFQLRKGDQVVSPEATFILSDILSDNQARQAAFGPNSALVIPQKTVAVKTGTSNEKRDNLTYGYTPSYVVGVWVGNNDNRPMHPVLTSGITGAAPIWQQIMTHLLAKKEDEKFTKPSTVIAIPCYYGRVEYFARGTEPAGGCVRLTPFGTPGGSPSPRARISPTTRR